MRTKSPSSSLIVAERPLVEPECDCLSFTGLKLDLDEIFKLLFGTNSKVRFIRYIKLYDFLACTVAGIRDNRIYCENIVIAYCGIGELLYRNIQMWYMISRDRKDSVLPFPFYRSICSRRIHPRYILRGVRRGR